MRRQLTTWGLAVMALVGAACTAAPPALQRPATTAPNPAPGCSVTSDAPAQLSPLPGRRAILTVPDDYTPARSHPLLVSLHPFTLAPEIWEAYSGLAAAAAARGYIVVTPLGSDPGPRWAVPGGLPGGPDDVAFIDALIDDAANLLCVDRDRVFAAGFSAGAAMAQALGCEIPDRFRAVASSGGANLTSLCPESDPVNDLVLHGTSDPIAPMGGSYIIFAPPLDLDIDDVVETNAERAGCAAPTRRQLTATVDSELYDKCESGKVVEFRRMIGAGHTWAGSPVFFEGIVGATDQSFSATDAVLDFFDHAP